MELNRRDFLTTAAALTAACYLPTTPAQAAEPLRLRKALKFGMVQAENGNTVLERFRLAKDCGFEGVDIDGPFAVEEVIAAQQETGLIVHGVVNWVHWGLPLSDAKAEVRAAGVAGMEIALRNCKAYGGTSVLLVPAVVKKEVSYAEAYTRSQAEIRKVIPLAAELQIKILFENVWNNFLLSPLEYARYIDEFESPWVGAYFDVGNIVRYGWPEHWIGTLGHRIGKLDIKEYSRKTANEQGVWKGFDAQIGEGEDGCDWPAVLTALKGINFSGWATAEVGGGGRERLTQISQQMDRAFAGYGAE